MHRPLLGSAVWRSTIALYLTVGGSILLVGSARLGSSTIKTGLTGANEWLERTTRSTSEALRLSLPLSGRFRSRFYGRRPFLMQQDSSRSAADDWEIGSREEMLAKLMDDKPNPEDTPHPLRTQDWKLEASTYRICVQQQPLLHCYCYYVMQARIELLISNGGAKIAKRVREKREARPLSF